MEIPFKPPQASENAPGYDLLFNAILGLTIVFTVIVGIMVLVLAVRYRRGNKVDRSNPMTHNTKLEMVLLTIPMLLGFGIFGWSADLFMKSRTVPEDANEIFVIGKQWMWHVQHMNGIRENNELHIPVGQPVKLTMISQDVIHSMYLPEFRTQYHVVPGRYTELSFTPTQTGTFKMLCAMHCGTQHSEMWGYVHVLPVQAYNEWVENQGNRFRPVAQTMEQAGAQVFKETGCMNCHGGQDTERGPSLLGIYGTERLMDDGSIVTVDEDYLRESLVNPYNRLTAGYTNTMPVYQGQLTEEQILQLVTYMKSPTAALDAAAAAPSFNAPTTSIDVANERASAGAAQAETTPR